MTLSYKRLGDYIEEYDVINSDKEFTSIEDLQGINNLKYFQECKSNKNDINLFKYKKCRKGMFSYNKATSRNGEKISIALREGRDCLVSPSYYCFKIKDEDVLSPDYLMLWFRRPIFDRLARFNSWGSATEFYSWDCFCDTKIIIPDITAQREIVTRVSTINKRIKALDAENDKVMNLCKNEMMRFKNLVSNSSETEFVELKDLVKSNINNYSKKDCFDTIEYLETGGITEGLIEETEVLDVEDDEIPGRCKRKVDFGDIIYSTVRPNQKHFGILYNNKPNFIVSTGFCVLTPIQNRISNEFIYMFLTDDDTISTLNEIAALSVTTYPSITDDDILNLSVEIPSNYDFSKLNNFLKASLALIYENNLEKRLLIEKQGLIIKNYIPD